VFPVLLLHLSAYGEILSSTVGSYSQLTCLYISLNTEQSVCVYLVGKDKKKCCSQLSTLVTEANVVVMA
jgi:hypothetical protein